VIYTPKFTKAETEQDDMSIWL